MNIKEYTDVELKALAWDNLTIMEQSQANITEINKELSARGVGRIINNKTDNSMDENTPQPEVEVPVEATPDTPTEATVSEETVA